MLDVETKGETLRVTVQRMGPARPTRLDICRERDPRTASAKRTGRLQYQRILERALKRSPEIDWTLLGIDERWRNELHAVFRKRPEKTQLSAAV